MAYSLSKTLELKHELENNTTDFVQFYNDFFNNMPDTKIWYYAEWKTARDKLIKDKCEQCGSTIKLTLQHMWQPMSIGYHMDWARSDILRDYDLSCEPGMEIERIVSLEELMEYKSRDSRSIYIENACPNCGSTGYTARKTKLPKYRCNRCKHEFDTPSTMEYETILDDITNAIPEEYTLCVEQTRLSKYRWQMYHERITSMTLEKYKQEIYRLALLNYIGEYIRYWSMVDTVTWCNKCAYMYDKHNKVLCENCGKNYRERHYDLCSECYKKTPEYKEDQEFWLEHEAFMDMVDRKRPKKEAEVTNG